MPKKSRVAATEGARPLGSGSPQTEVRNKILAAAVDLFYHQGYAPTSVQEIVEQAGYTKGALYHYFDSKEAILLEIHNAFMTYAIERSREIVALNASPSVKLENVMRELLRQVELYRPHMTIFLDETHRIDFSKYPLSKAMRDEWEEMVVDVISRGIEIGEFRADIASPRALSFGVAGMCVWAHRWLKRDGELSADEISAMYARVILLGLRAKV